VAAARVDVAIDAAEASAFSPAVVTRGSTRGGT
jgi:hypothetical protein